MRRSIFLFKKIFLEGFDQEKKLKIGFPIILSNLARKGLGFFCHARALIFHQTFNYDLSQKYFECPFSKKNKHYKGSETLKDS